MDELFDVYEDMELEDKEKQKMKKMARNNLIKYVVQITVIMLT